MEGCTTTPSPPGTIGCSCTHLTDFAGRYAAIEAPSGPAVFALPLNSITSYIPVPIIALSTLFILGATMLVFAVVVASTHDRGAFLRFRRALEGDPELAFLRAADECRLARLRATREELERKLQVLRASSSTTSTSSPLLASAAARHAADLRRELATVQATLRWLPPMPRLLDRCLDGGAHAASARGGSAKVAPLGATGAGGGGGGGGGGREVQALYKSLEAGLAQLALSEEALQQALLASGDGEVKRLAGATQQQQQRPSTAASDGSKSWASLFSGGTTASRLEKAAAAGRSRGSKAAAWGGKGATYSSAKPEVAAATIGSSSSAAGSGAQALALAQESWTESGALRGRLHRQRMCALSFASSPLGLVWRGYYGGFYRPVGLLLLFSTLGTYVLLACMVYTASPFRTLPGRNSWMVNPTGRAAIGGACIIGFLVALLAGLINGLQHRLFRAAARADLEWRFPLLAAELRRRRAVEEVLAETPTRDLLERLKRGARVGEAPAILGGSIISEPHTPRVAEQWEDKEGGQVGMDAAAAAAQGDAAGAAGAASAAAPPPHLPLWHTLLGGHVPRAPAPPSEGEEGALAAAPPHHNHAPAWEIAALQALAEEDARVVQSLQQPRPLSLDFFCPPATQGRRLPHQAARDGARAGSPPFNRGAWGLSLFSALLYASSLLYCLLCFLAYVMFSLGKGEAAAAMVLLAALAACAATHTVVFPLYVALLGVAGWASAPPLFLPPLQLSQYHASTAAAVGAVGAEEEGGEFTGEEPPPPSSD